MMSSSVDDPVIMEGDVEKRAGFTADEEKKFVSENLAAIDSEQEVLVLQDLDPAMNKKMHLVNNVSTFHMIEGRIHADSWTAQTLDEIGWTNYHWKLFFLNGFG